MRIGLDATPMIGERSGIGHWTAQIVRALAGDTDGPDVHLIPFTWRGVDDLPDPASFGPRVTASHRRVPARPLRELWARLEWPPVEWVSGPVDVFHATNYVLPPLRRAAGVLTVHDLTYLHHPEWVRPDVARYADLVPRGIRRCGAMTTLSETVRGELLATYDLDPATVVVAPAGVDLATFDRPPLSAERRAQLGVPDDYVLFLGTREPRKGLGTLLDAYRRLGADAVPLVVAGGRGWGLQPADADLRVQVLGYVANADVPDLVAGARLLAFPSFYEGFGMPPLEALAAGTAVVASDLPVLREVLGDQATFAPAGDADAWAEALRREWSRSPADDDAARPARRAQAGTFSWARAAAAARSAYDIALERRRG